jgi:hypothetical protein
MFRASSAHIQEDTVVHVQHMVLSLSMRVRGGLLVHSLSENCVLYPPEDEHLRLETCRGEYYFMNK